MSNYSEGDDVSSPEPEIRQYANNNNKHSVLKATGAIAAVGGILATSVIVGYNALNNSKPSEATTVTPQPGLSTETSRVTLPSATSTPRREATPAPTRTPEKKVQPFLAANRLIVTSADGQVVVTDKNNYAVTLDIGQPFNEFSGKQDTGSGTPNNTHDLVAFAFDSDNKGPIYLGYRPEKNSNSYVVKAYNPDNPNQPVTIFDYHLTSEEQSRLTTLAANPHLTVEQYTQVNTLGARVSLQQVTQKGDTPYLIFQLTTGVTRKDPTDRRGFGYDLGGIEDVIANVNYNFSDSRGVRYGELSAYLKSDPSRLSDFIKSLVASQELKKYRPVADSFNSTDQQARLAHFLLSSSPDSALVNYLITNQVKYPSLLQQIGLIAKTGAGWSQDIVGDEGFIYNVATNSVVNTYRPTHNSMINLNHYIYDSGLHGNDVELDKLEVMALVLTALGQPDLAAVYHRAFTEDWTRDSIITYNGQPTRIPNKVMYGIDPNIISPYISVVPDGLHQSWRGRDSQMLRMQNSAVNTMQKSRV